MRGMLNGEEWNDEKPSREDGMECWVVGSGGSGGKV